MENLYNGFVPPQNSMCHVSQQGGSRNAHYHGLHIVLNSLRYIFFIFHINYQL